MVIGATYPGGDAGQIGGGPEGGRPHSMCSSQGTRLPGDGVEQTFQTEHFLFRRWRCRLLCKWQSWSRIEWW